MTHDTSIRFFGQLVAVGSGVEEVRFKDLNRLVVFSYRLKYPFKSVSGFMLVILILASLYCILIMYSA